MLSSGNWYRLLIGCNGIYRIPYTKLREIGYSNPQDIRIFGFGKECKLLHRQGYVYFYAQGPCQTSYNTDLQMETSVPDIYSGHSCYLISDLSKSQYNNKIDIVSYSNASATACQGIFNYHHELMLHNLQNSGQRWFGEKMSQRATESIRFECNNAPSKARVGAVLASRSLMGESFEIKASDIRHNVSLPATTDNGPYATTASCGFDYVPQASDIQIIDITFNKNWNQATGYIDFVSLETLEKLSYNKKQLIFRHKAGGQSVTSFEVENMGAEHIVMDVSAGTPYIIEHQDGNFIAQTQSDRRFAVCAPKDAMEPIFDGKVGNQDLGSATDTEYLIVTPEKLRPYAQQIADLHSDLKCLVVTDMQIYNEYSSGMPTPAAIRDFAKDIWTKGGRLRYLLLFGDGSSDNFHKTPNNTNILPTYQSVNSLNENGSHSFVSDDYFGIFDDDGDCHGQLHIGVGRIPVNTDAEAQVAVDKIGNYIDNQRGGDFRKQIVMAADDENMNLHVQQAESLCEMIEVSHPEFDISKIYLDNYKQESSAAGDTYPEAHRAMVESFENGALIINYIGHGGMRFFADERILTIDDIDQMRNADCLPVVITASCDIGHFDYYDHESDQSRQSPAERMVLNPNGGAIAMLTATREVSANPNHILHRNILTYILEAGTRLGDAIRKAKIATNDRNMLNFVLLGDPALIPHIPEQNIEVTKINGTDIELFDGKLKAMETYTVECEVSEKEKFKSGMAYITVFDKARTSKTRDNDGQGAFEFTEYGNTIFRGKSTLYNGGFRFEFTVPKDIDYADGQMRISLYAENGKSASSGANKSLIIGGSSQTAQYDNEGPSIVLKSIQDRGESKVLNFTIGDPSGINVTASSGHGITVTDTENGKSQDVTKLYVADADCQTQGTLQYTTNGLDDGIHTIRIRAWDNMNNPSEREFKIAVTNHNTLKIYNLRCFPNPCSGHVWVDFAHNAQDGMVEYTVSLITMQGKTVWTGQGTLQNGEPGFDIDIPAQNADGMYLLRLLICDQKQNTAKSSVRLMYIK